MQPPFIVESSNECRMQSAECRINAPTVQFMNESSIHDEVNSCRKAIHSVAVDGIPLIEETSRSDKGVMAKP